MKKLVISLFLGSSLSLAHAQQSVSIGTTDTKTNAVLYLKGDGKQGLIIPVTPNHLNVAPTEGMIVYNSTDGKIYKCNGTTWSSIEGGGSGGSDSQTLAVSGNTLSISGGNAVTIANAAPTQVGQLLMWNGTNWVPTSTTVPNTTGQVLKWNNTTKTWEAGTDNGTAYTAGTGISVTGTTIANTGDTDATNDITTSSTATGDLSGTFPNLTIKTGAVGLTHLANGPANNVLTTNGSGTPTWAPGGGGMTNPMTTLGDIIVGNAGGTPARLAGSAGFLKSTGAALPVWSALAATDIPALDVAKVTTGVFPIARGGTGLSTAPTNGQLLIGNGTNFTLSTLTAGTGINITNGTGTITISNTGANPMTAANDMIIGGASGAATRLVAPAANQILTSNGTSAITWAPQTNFVSASTSQTANTVFAAPNGSAGTPVFRTLFNADIAGTAAIAGTKINPDFGAQNVNTNNDYRINGTAVLKNGGTNVIVGNNTPLATVGSNNSILGAQAGTAMGGTATNNTYVGYQAGSGTTSGSSNTFIGSQVGSNTTTGSSNIFIGSTTGLNHTTGSFNVLVGVGADIAGAGSFTNSVAIGHNAVAAGNNVMALGGTGSDAINVGINTNLPTQRLDVVGNIKFSGALMPNNLPGAAGQVLTSAGPGNAPTWTSPSGGGFSTLNAIPKGDGSALVASQISDNATNVAITSLSPILQLVSTSGIATSAASSIEFSNSFGQVASIGDPGSSDNLQIAATNGIDFNTAFNTRVTIDASGNLGVGSTNQFMVNNAGNITKINNITASFPAAQGAANTFLKNDGAGNLSWATTGGGFSTLNTIPKGDGTTLVASQIFDNGTDVGIGTTSPLSKMHITGGGLLINGGTGGTPTSGAGTRLMWIPAKAAIRAGSVGTEWDDANIGSGSAAFGSNNMASGSNSTTIGQANIASGARSFAGGVSSTASGNGSTALGEGVTASTRGGFAVGHYNVGGGSASSFVATDPVFEIGIGASSGSPANALTVLHGGNVGIGTNTPTHPLQLKSLEIEPANTGTTASGQLRLSGTGTPVSLDVGVADDIFSGGWLQAHQSNNQSLNYPLILNPNGGSVSVGFASPTAKFQVADNSAGYAMRFDQGSTGDGFIGYVNSNSSARTVLQASSLAGTGLIVQADGKVGMSRTPATNNLEIGGNASKSVAGGWLANSDRRIKTDILEIENSLSIIKKLHPVKFKYTAEWMRRNPSIKDQHYYNFIAQEFQQVFPEAVQGSGEFIEGDKTEILQIDTYNAQIVSIKAIQEQQKIIEAQQEEINILKKELDSIKSYLNMEAKAGKKKKSKK